MCVSPVMQSCMDIYTSRLNDVVENDTVENDAAEINVGKSGVK